jgi:hypothetical protein
MFLKQILDYALTLEEKGHPEAALTYVQKQLVGGLSEDVIAVNEELKLLPIHLYSTDMLTKLITVSYYWKEVLPNRQELWEKIYNEILFIRGCAELEEALLILQ